VQALSTFQRLLDGFTDRGVRAHRFDVRNRSCRKDHVVRAIRFVLALRDDITAFAGARLRVFANAQGVAQYRMIRAQVIDAAVIDKSVLQRVTRWYGVVMRGL